MTPPNLLFLFTQETTHHSWKEWHIQKLIGKPRDTGCAVKLLCDLKEAVTTLLKRCLQQKWSNNFHLTNHNFTVIQKTVFGLCASNLQLSVSWSLSPSCCVFSSMSIVCLSFGTLCHSVSTKPPSTQHNLNFLHADIWKVAIFVHLEMSHYVQSCQYIFIKTELCFCFFF